MVKPPEVMPVWLRRVGGVITYSIFH